MTIYAMLSGRFSRAVAVEPDPWNREILAKNLEINGLNDRVVIVGKAVSDRAGTMQLFRDAKNFGAHSLEPGFVLSPDASERHVAVESLDRILADAGVHAGDVGFVKIDVEGHEFAVLAGMTDVLAERPPVMIEVTFADARAVDRGQSVRAQELADLRRLITMYATVLDIERADQSGAIEVDQFEVTAGQHELLFI